MKRTLIKAGTVLTMDDQRGIFEPGHLLIEGQKIIAVGKPEEIPAEGAAVRTNEDYRRLNANLQNF